MLTVYICIFGIVIYRTTLSTISLTSVYNDFIDF